ncbi:ATP-binding protein [Salibacterium aidingense]|uniref:ATP-binding protein n=1 Tax=Salibacterium aidingense TaxID=384933 RepID=UPI0003F8838A|nr:AAA family ATPase [Salibacterium aidingense]
MKIEGLHMYGFGKFYDKTISLGSPFHVIRGENEAGKSTIRSFIQMVLFGFPTKKEKALRYEPKQGGRHGGNVSVQLENGTRAVIERTAGKKAAGEVTVYTENGERYGEEWLHAVLGNIDRGMFKGIFCFGLEGLSEIQRLKGEELNQYIYEAGMTGTKYAAQIEKKLNGQMEVLYKAKGQKPAINKKLKELQQQRIHLREWEAQFERYDRLIQEMQETAGNLEEVKKKKQNLYIDKEYQQRKQTMERFYQEKENIEHRLQALAPYEDISLEWEQEFKDWDEKYKEAKQQEEEREITLKQMENKHKGAANTWFLLSNKDRFYSLKEKLPLYKKYLEDYESLRFQLAQKKHSLKEKQERLGESYEKELSLCVTSLAAEEELYQLTAKAKRMQERIRLLEEQCQQQRDKVSHLQNELERMMEKQRAEEKRIQKEESESERNKNQRKSWNQPVFMLQLSAIIFMTLGIWESTTGHWLIGLIMFGAGVSAGILWYLQNQQKKRYTGNMGASNSRSTADLDTLQRLDASIREVEWQLERETNMYESLERKEEQESENWKMLLSDFEQWAETCHFPSIPSLLTAETFFASVKEWKELQNNILHLKKEKEAAAMGAHTIKQETKQLGGQLGVTGEDPAAVIPMLGEMMEKEEKQNSEWNQEAEIWIAARDQKTYFTKIKEQAEEIIAQLLKKTETDTAISFYRAIAQKKEYIEWGKKYEWLMNQLQSHLYPGESINAWMEEVRKEGPSPSQEMAKIEEALHQAVSEEEDLQNKLAELKQEQRHIEEGGTYEQDLQQYEEMKQDLQQDAHRWMVLKAASAILREAKSVYEKERQPDVIQTASRHFSYITQGHYSRLFAPLGKETFIVEDQFGIWFSPEELSRGTAEQLYLSLRLALADNYSHSEPFPFILDDPFVNFDAERQNLAFDLVERASANRQILYFTCGNLPKAVVHSSTFSELEAEM